MMCGHELSNQTQDLLDPLPKWHTSIAQHTDAMEKPCYHAILFILLVFCCMAGLSVLTGAGGSADAGLGVVATTCLILLDPVLILLHADLSAGGADAAGVGTGAAVGADALGANDVRTMIGETTVGVGKFAFTFRLPLSLASPGLFCMPTC